jgi:hypothetical protein
VALHSLRVDSHDLAAAAAPAAQGGMSAAVCTLKFALCCQLGQ